MPGAALTGACATASASSVVGGWRERFFVPDGGPYALTHSVGCLPRKSAVALERAYLEPWREAGGEAWPMWLSAVDAFRINLARLLGGTHSEYCPQANLSSALSKLLPALATQHRRVVLLAEDAFPSLGFVVDRASRFGLEARILPRTNDVADPGTWEQALTADVAAVLVMHVHSNTGVRSPAPEIARLCRDRGIFCIVDIAQSAGVLEVSVPQIDADVVLGSCVKWLCGGPGAGFMWIHPRCTNALEPADVGWFSHAEPFELDIHSFTYAPDARRFWGGTPSVAPFALAAESIELIGEIGAGELHHHNRSLCHAFLDELPRDLRRDIDLDRLGGTLCLPLADRFDGVVRELRSIGARFDSRGDTVRLSFHIYNTTEEAAQLGAACKLGGGP